MARPAAIHQKPSTPVSFVTFTWEELGDMRKAGESYSCLLTRLSQEGLYLKHQTATAAFVFEKRRAHTG